MRRAVSIGGGPARVLGAMVGRMADTPESTPASTSDQAKGSARNRRRDGPPPTPFDHPLFMPVLFAGFALWFGYDGWLTTDADMLENHGNFNRYGFFVLVAAFVFTTFRAIREMRENAARKTHENDAGSP